MPSYLVIVLAPLLYILGFLGFFYWGLNIWVILVLLFLIVTLSLRFLSRLLFWHYKLLYLNLFLSFLAQLIFLVMLSSSSWRIVLLFVLTFIWALVWWLISRYYSASRETKKEEYLAALKWFYYLNYWFLAVALYALIVLIQLRFYWVLSALLLASLSFGAQIVIWDKLRRFAYIWLGLILCLQLISSLYLLSIHFFTAGTLATLFFFFIFDKNLDSWRFFKTFVLGLTAAVIILLFTSTL